MDFFGTFHRVRNSLFIFFLLIANFLNVYPANAERGGVNETEPYDNIGSDGKNCASLINENYVWEYLLAYQYFNPVVKRMKFEGIEVIDNQTYHKFGTIWVHRWINNMGEYEDMGIDEHPDFRPILLREDNGKVYRRFKDAMPIVVYDNEGREFVKYLDEVLIYDFNVREGETTVLFNPCGFYSSELVNPGPAIDLGVIEIGGKPRRHYTYERLKDMDISFIDGIGVTNNGVLSEYYLYYSVASASEDTYYYASLQAVYDEEMNVLYGDPYSSVDAIPDSADFYIEYCGGKYIVVRGDQDCLFTMRILSLDGKLIKETETFGNHIVSLDELEKGIYLICASDGKKEKYLKIVK